MIGFSLFLLFPALLVAAALATHNGSPEMRRLLGGILLAVGLLVMTGSGLCSLAVIGGAGSASSDPSAWFLVLLIGGIPFGGGFGLFWWGRHLIRSARPPSDDELRDRFD